MPAILLFFYSTCFVACRRGYFRNDEGMCEGKVSPGEKRKWEGWNGANSIAVSTFPWFYTSLQTFTLSSITENYIALAETFFDAFR